MKLEKNPQGENSIIDIFAAACEQMNDFARSLRRQGHWGDVTTGADIRQYESGWRLEKWIEAQLDPAEGLCAAWWLELGPADGGWSLRSNLAISPDKLYVGLVDRFASSPAELKHVLSSAVEELTNALDRNSQFAREVKNYRK